VAISEQRVYDYAVREHGAAVVSGIPQAELLRANNEIKRYLTVDDAGGLEIQVRNSRGQSEPLFSTKETAHMADVRGLVRGLFAVQLGAVLTALVLGAVLAIFSPRTLALAGLRGGLLTVGILVGAGVVAASGFDSAWTQFHQVSFSNDFWELDPRSDHLIQMFPEAFWQEVTTAIVVVTLLEALMMIGTSATYLLARGNQNADLMFLPTPGIAKPFSPQDAHLPAKLNSPKTGNLFR
jgi:integral membrane protein (TIGR01906 family)